MTKYRVKEITNKNETYYILQKRCFLIIWKVLESWNKFEFQNEFSSPYRFSSKDKAKDYLVGFLMNEKEQRLKKKKKDNIVAYLDKNGVEILPSQNEIKEF